MVQEDRWTYEERQNDARLFVVIPALILFIAAFIMTVMTVRSRGVIPAIIVMAVGITLYAFTALARKTVVIDRRSGIVWTGNVGTLRRRRDIRALNEFDRVAVWERRTPIDAGYYAANYSIVLLGGKGPMPLLTTDDEKEAASVRDEVALFLRFK